MDNTKPFILPTGFTVTRAEDGAMYLGLSKYVENELYSRIGDAKAQVTNMNKYRNSPDRGKTYKEQIKYRAVQVALIPVHLLTEEQKLMLRQNQ